MFLDSFVNLIKAKLGRGGFISQVLVLGRGTGIAQAALICFSPVLSRIYDPEAFAVYALFAVVSQLCSIIGSGRYEMALMIPKKNQDASLALAIAAGMPLLLTTAAYLVMVGCGILGFISEGWYWFVPAGALVFAWGTVALRWQSRMQRFSEIAFSELIAVSMAIAFQLIAGVLSKESSGINLIIGQLLGRSFALAYLWQSMKHECIGHSKTFTTFEIIKTAKRFINFPLYTCTSSLIGKVNLEMPKLMLAAYFGPHTLGLYALCSRVLGTPTGMVGRAISDVFFPRLSKRKHESHSIRGMVVRVSGTCLLLIAGPSLILFFWAEPIFSFVFGEQWAESGTYARLLLPVCIAQFAVQPISFALQVIEKQRYVFAWQVCSLLLLAGVFLNAQYLQSPDFAILCYSLALAFMYACYFMMVIYFSKHGQGVQFMEEETYSLKHKAA